MKNPITPEVVEQYTDNSLLEIIELEDRLELAALQSDCCAGRCSDNEYPDILPL